MFIYKTTNLINGKIYVGQHKKDNPKYLGSGLYLDRAVLKYGKENFKREILEDNIPTIEELNEREIFWIKELDSKRPNGYNLSDGGASGSYGMVWTEEQRKNLDCKTTYQYDGKTGKFLNEYYSAKEASKISNINVSCIHGVCKNRKKTAGGYVWSYEKYDIIDLENYINTKEPNVVFQYDLEGNFINKYPSESNAHKVTGIKHINACCNGKRLNAGKFIWSHYELSKEELDEMIFDIKYQKNGKPIFQLDLDNNIIMEYISIVHAFDVTGIKQISSCCRNRQKTAGGYKWKFK